MTTKLERRSTNQVLIVDHEIKVDEKGNTYLFVKSLRGCVFGKREYLYTVKDADGYIAWLKKQGFKVLSQEL